MLMLFGRIYVICTNIMIIGIVLVQCGYNPSPPKPQLHWKLIVPDNYSGFLVIKYNCANGVPLNKNGSLVIVNFRDDGTFCTTDASFEWRGEETAERRSGQSIPRPFIWDGKGYGLYTDGSITFHGPPRQEFEVYWVGDIGYLASIRNNGPYEAQLTDFLKTHFDLDVP